jgi:hypothetical protein
LRVVLKESFAFAARHHLLYLVLLGALIAFVNWRSPRGAASTTAAAAAAAVAAPTDDEITQEAARIEEAMRGHERVLVEAHLFGREGKELTSPIPDRTWWTEDALASAAGAEVARAAMTTAIGAQSTPIAAAWGTWIVTPIERRPRYEPNELRGEAALSLRRRKAAAP